MSTINVDKQEYLLKTADGDTILSGGRNVFTQTLSAKGVVDMSYHFELSKTNIHRLDRYSLANIHGHRLSFATKTLKAEKEKAELKLLDRREAKSSYVGANLQSSRTPSAIDSHCRNSYQVARRKLHSSRAKVRFYVAGENNHNAIYAVSPQRFASFDTLLGSLTKTPICREQDKERYIFSLNGSHKITALNELHPGESYVCATYDVFEQLSVDKERPVSSANRFKTLQSAALAAARPTHTSQSTRSRHSAQENHQQKEVSEESEFIAEIKPRLITVLRGGMKPRKSVRILLSKKNTRSFEQTVAGIGEILCPGEQVKRIFSISGRLVMCLADFYLDDTVFFAYCNDKMNPEDLSLDKAEVKCVGAYRFRKASAYGRVTLTSHQKGVNDERPKSMCISPLPDVHLTSESRTGSRAKSCRPSLVSSTPRLPESPEKHTEEAMEKAQHMTDKAEEATTNEKTTEGKTQSLSGSQSSIKTASHKSDKSKESIHLAHSRPPSTRPTSEIHQAKPNSNSRSPVHSPSKKRHPSQSSQSPTKDPVLASGSRVSVRERTETPKSPAKQRHVSETSQAPIQENHPHSESQTVIKDDKQPTRSPTPEEQQTSKVRHPSSASSVKSHHQSEASEKHSKTSGSRRPSNSSIEEKLVTSEHPEAAGETKSTTSIKAVASERKSNERPDEDADNNRSQSKEVEEEKVENGQSLPLPQEKEASPKPPTEASEVGSTHSVKSAISATRSKEELDEETDNKSSKSLEPKEEKPQTPPAQEEAVERRLSSKTSSSPTLSKRSSKTSRSSSRKSSQTSVTKDNSKLDEDIASTHSSNGGKAKNIQVSDSNIQVSDSNDEHEKSDNSRPASKTSKKSEHNSINEITESAASNVETNIPENDINKEPEAPKEELIVDENQYTDDFEVTSHDGK